MNKKTYNIAFIDGQNLHLGTTSSGREIDYHRFRVYLKDKFKVQEAYYFLGYVSDDEQDLYSDLQKAGFIIIFREHSSNLKGKKKGNVDADVVFEIMRKVADKEKFDKMVLVSGDGDYIKTVKYLIQKNLLEKILFPNKHYSSLYRPIQDKFGSNLSNSDIKQKIQYKKKETS